MSDPLIFSGLCNTALDAAVERGLAGRLRCDGRSRSKIKETREGGVGRLVCNCHNAPHRLDIRHCCLIMDSAPTRQHSKAR